MVKFRVPRELVEECGRLIVWRRLNRDSEALSMGEKFKAEVVRHLGEALWDYIEGLDDAARVFPGDQILGAPGRAAVKRTKH